MLPSFILYVCDKSFNQFPIIFRDLLGFIGPLKQCNSVPLFPSLEPPITTFELLKLGIRLLVIYLSCNFKAFSFKSLLLTGIPRSLSLNK